ncbi:MAG: PaaI family thioesterase [Actinomycetes bacterium]
MAEAEDVPIWVEPVRGGTLPAAAFGLSGVEQLRLFLTGKALPPPIGHLTGMRPTEIGVGSATFTMPITEWLATPQGIATGGEVAILADGPLGCAIQTMLPPGTGYTTSELSINMVRPVPRAGQLIARGRLVHAGRQLGLSEVFVTDDAGRLIAHGTSRCVIFSPVEVPAVSPDDFPLASEPDDGWVPPHARPVCGDVLPQDVWSTRDGLDVMRAHITGELPAPPISHLLGTVPVDVGEGTCTFAMPATGWLTSPIGTVEGGVTACLADLALASAVQTTVPAGTAYAPTDLRVQFIRPVHADGRTVTARATVVHRGRGVAVARADVTNEDGKLVAVATGSSMILPGRPADLSDDPRLRA